MNRVKIEIDDEASPRRFTDVALFVDQPGFVEDLEQVRKILKIKSGRYQVGVYGIEEVDRLACSYKTGTLSISQFCLGVSDYCINHNLSFPRVDGVMALARKHAEILAKKYRRESLYVPVAIVAIVENVVSERDYQPTQIIHLDKQSLRHLADELGGFEEMSLLAIREHASYAIRVDSETAQEDLLEAFRFIRKYYLKDIVSSRSDTISNVRRDRDWYWEEITKHGYNRIFKEKGEGVDSWDGVRKGIKQYIKALKLTNL